MRWWILSTLMLSLAAFIFLRASDNRHLQYFGYFGVDCAVDDPFDFRNQRHEYAKEVSGFTNVAQLCVKAFDEDLRSRFDGFHKYGLRALLDLRFIFYRFGVNSQQVAIDLGLRRDYRERWQTFLKVNHDWLNLKNVAALLPIHQPLMQGVQFEELNPVIDMIKESLPEIPVLINVAVERLDELQVPARSDWLGLVFFGVTQPDRDLDYRRAWENLKAKRSASQKAVVIMESQWLKAYDGTGTTPLDMAKVARAYYRFAQGEKDAVALLAYTWPGGQSGVLQKGVRNLPTEVQATHQQLGQEIIKAN